MAAVWRTSTSHAAPNMDARGECCCQGTENAYAMANWNTGPLADAAPTISGASRRFPGIVLVIVKEARNLLLQLGRVARLARGGRLVEKLPLDARSFVPVARCWRS